MIQSKIRSSIIALISLSAILTSTEAVSGATPSEKTAANSPAAPVKTNLRPNLPPANKPSAPKSPLVAATNAAPNAAVVSPAVPDKSGTPVVQQRSTVVPPAATEAPAVTPAVPVQSPAVTPPPAVRSPFVNGHYVLGPTIRINGYHSFEPVVVIVDLSSHYTHVLQLQKDDLVRLTSISNSIGKGATPTPPGRYLVVKKELNPKWIPTKSIDPKQKPVEPYIKDKRNGLGVAKINLNKFDIALHGTNAPTKIRQDVSHGCIRHSNKDIMRLYGLVKRGTVVYIVKQWSGKVLNEQDFVKKPAKSKPKPKSKKTK
jgi:lipoprotein-anchoring transpeptidase ErfK/SrfK